MGRCWVFVLGFFILSVRVNATIDCETLNRNWAAYHHKDFKVNWPLTKFKCPSTASKIAEAFYHLEKVQFKTSDNAVVPNFYMMLKKMTTVTSFDPPQDQRDWVFASADTTGHLYLHKAFPESF